MSKNLTVKFRCPTSERVVFSYCEIRDFGFAENKNFLALEKDGEVILFPVEGYIIEVEENNEN